MPAATVSTMAKAQASSAPKWHGSLKLSLAIRDNASRLVERRHSGPLVIQRPFYPEGKHCCHLYLLHPPGGLVGGDQLVCDFALGKGSHGLITTPSAGKAYRVDALDREQGQHTALTLSDGAIVEWLPQESIAFNGAQLSLSTRIDFEPSSTLIGWDILCLGRPAANELFTRGCVQQRLELWCQGEPKLLELAHYRGAGPIMRAPWGLAGNPVVASFYAYWPETDERATSIEAARDLIACHGCEGLCEATVVNDILLVRYLGKSTEEARLLFIHLWQSLRPITLHRIACPPRIWNT